MLKIRDLSSVKLAFCLVIILLVQASPSHGGDLIYTLQAASFPSELYAQQQYDLLASRLNNSEHQHLRIEKVGRFYSVRIGGFSNKKSADSFADAIRPKVGQLLVIKAYIKKDRIIRQYPDPAHIDSGGAPDARAEKKVLKEPALSVTTAISEEVFDETAAMMHQAKGDIYWELSRTFMAMEEYEQAIRFGLKHPDFFRQYAKLLFLNGYIREAIIQMEKAVQMRSDFDAFRIDLGILYLADRKLEKAQAEFVSALELNPTTTHIYIYLADISLKTGAYDMAWFYIRRAEHLGHKGQGLVSKLSALSSEPDLSVLNSGGKGLFIRQILVSSRQKAQEVLLRIGKDELFELIAEKESLGPNAAKGGYIGEVDSSAMHPEIVAALIDSKVLSQPVIVETENGFHVLQRVEPFNHSVVSKALAGS
ncbi:MAG: peptidylprolyl isomerase [Nitrospira sp.]|nr:peptidylprolyl isomerase [bacterium]MBL7049263.1 peptidylprolyl isomerase [Nitrospira sp.]